MKKIFTFIILSVFSLNTINAKVTWELSEDGTLTISGTGDMKDYNPDFSPWLFKRENIKNVIIKNGVTSIGSYAFYYFTDLTSITIPNSITSIGEKAFEGCTDLISITIPNSVTSIGENAFAYCTGFTSITVPNSVTYIGTGAFTGCQGLTSMNVESGNIYYDSRNNCNAIIRKNDNTLIYGCNGTIIPNNVTNIGSYSFLNCTDIKSITIPNSVTSIDYYAFCGCTNLTSITIPNSVKNIDGGAFSGCTGLTSITIPNSVTTIWNETFYGCTGLTSITIPNSVTTIWDETFYGCTGLTSITIPNSVTTIGDCAFKGCKGLKKVTIEVNKDLQIKKQAFLMSNLKELIMLGETLPNSTDDDFAYRLYNTTNLYVPSSLYEEYLSTSPWSKFANIMTLEQRDEVNKITSDAVIAKINAIGNIEYTDACKDKIDAASTAYNALTDDQKALVTNSEALTTAKQTYDALKIAAEKLVADKTAANAVINKIETIGKVKYTDACKGKIDDASTAYDALTDDQKALVSNLEVLTTAKQTYETLKAAAEKLAADKAKADAVIAKISAIGKVKYTDACKKKIDNASNAYNALTDDQKALVSNLEVLTTAKQTYETLKAAAEKLAADKAKADPVIAKINGIGNVEYTDVCKEKIDDASTAYDALTVDQKALVTNLDVLTTAKQTYETLKAAAEKLASDKVKADPVIAKINAIGNVEYTDACKDKIDDASNAYDALTDDQKTLVTNLEVLTTAKQNYNMLKAAADELMAYKTAFENYKSELKAIIEALGKEDDSDAVKAIINKAISDIDALEYDGAISLDDNKAKINSLVTSVNEAVEKQRAEDQKTTGINELQITNDELPVYDLNGKKITNSMLKSGLYIRNGKKVVVK